MPSIWERHLPHAANFLATVGGLSVMGRIVMGKMADRLGSKKGFVIGLILMSIALVGLVSFKMLWVIFILAGIFGIAYGTCVATQSPMVAELFGLGSHGAILGFLILRICHRRCFRTLAVRHHLRHRRQLSAGFFDVRRSKSNRPGSHGVSEN